MLQVVCQFFQVFHINLNIVKLFFRVGRHLELTLFRLRHYMKRGLIARIKRL